MPPPFPHHSESPDCSITGMSSLPPANVLFHSAHSLPPQVITKNICSCKSWYFINRSITFATPQNPLSIPSINTNWPYAAANTTIHRLVAAKESSTGKVQAKTMHHGIGFKPTENISKNTSWKLNMPVNTINLIFFYVIFWNGGKINVLNHSCQILSYCTFVTDWDWSTRQASGGALLGQIVIGAIKKFVKRRRHDSITRTPFFISCEFFIPQLPTASLQ